MRLGRTVTDRLWTPGSTRYTSTISVIERPEDEEKEKDEAKKKVPFGFGIREDDDQ